LVSPGTLCLALLAVLRVVLELFVVEKYLFACCKNELCPAVDTLERSIVEFHGRLPLQGLTPKSAMVLDNLPVPVPCFLSECKTWARTALKKRAVDVACLVIPVNLAA
jgi:hypothetical protein